MAVLVVDWNVLKELLSIEIEGRLSAAIGDKVGSAVKAFAAKNRIGTSALEGLGRPATLHEVGSFGSISKSAKKMAKAAVKSSLSSKIRSSILDEVGDSGLELLGLKLYLIDSLTVAIDEAVTAPIINRVANMGKAGSAVARALRVVLLEDAARRIVTEAIEAIPWQRFSR